MCAYVYHTQWQYLQRTNYPLNHQYSITKWFIVSNLSGLQWLHIFTFIHSLTRYSLSPMFGARKDNFYSTSYYSYYWTEHLFNINWIKLSLLRSCMCLVHECHIVVYLKAAFVPLTLLWQWNSRKPIWQWQNRCQLKHVLAYTSILPWWAPFLPLNLHPCLVQYFFFVLIFAMARLCTVQLLLQCSSSNIFHLHCSH